MEGWRGWGRGEEDGIELVRGVIDGGGAGEGVSMRLERKEGRRERKDKSRRDWWVGDAVLCLERQEGEREEMHTPEG